MPIVYQQNHTTPRKATTMTENHPTGQNPTPAHTAAAMAIALCGLLTLTGEQLQHLGAAIAVLGGVWPMAAGLNRRT